MSKTLSTVKCLITTALLIGICETAFGNTPLRLTKSEWKMIRKPFANINVRFIGASFCLWIIGTLLGSCDRLKGITTIYGTVTAPGYGPVDSVRISVIASNGFVRTKFLTNAYTDKEGKYEVTVDAPRGYSQIECSVVLDSDPVSSKEYRVAEAWQDGKKIKNCCSVVAGWKANFDFKLFK
ncbi:hypothetical protein [Dyadobacter fermentans]|nr:hypothetical protein [Dyadobacter fermentans]